MNNLEIAEQSRVRAVCMSNSFPRPNHDGLRGYGTMDWRLWRSARDAFPFMYGDYGAMHRIRRQNTYMPADWRSTVTYPLNEEWKIYRHPNANDPQGWVDGSVAITGDASFDAQSCWGTDLIRQASTGNLHDAGSTRFWHAAKVNIHIHRQLPFAKETITHYDEDEEP